VENINLHKDGRFVVLETSGVPFFDEKGKLLGYRGIDRDVTERKQVEMARQESEQKFRAVVQNAQAVIFILDMNGVFLLSEGQALAKLGLAPGQMVGLSALQVYGHNQAVLDGITKSLAGELTRFTSVEQGVVFDTVCSPYYNLEGKLTGVIGIAIDITERHRAEEALQMFQYTIDRARDAVQWLNREGGFEYVNEQACRSLGYTREELMQLHLWDIDPIYPRERWDKNWEDYQAGRLGGSESVETLHRRKDGSVFPVDVSSNHLWFGDRELHVAVVRDITERKQAEEALRESEQKFRLFVEQSSVGLVFTDEHGIIIEWNSAQERLTGLTREESIGQPLWEIQPKMSSAPSQLPETSQRVKQMIQLALQSGQADFLDRPMEIGLFRRDGTKIFVEQIAFSIKTNQGYRLGSISRDITQLKLAEDGLRASEERYRQLVEVSPIPMWINKDEIITYMNPAALQALGAADLEQVLGKAVLDFIHPDYHAVVKERIVQMVEEEKIVHLLEEKFVRLDGTIIDVEVIATPFSTSDTHAMQVLFQDITDRKQTEEALKQSEAKFRTLAEQSPNMTFINVKGKVVYANKACERALGYTVEELCSPNFDFFSLIASDYRSFVGDKFAKHTKGEDIEAYEYAIVAKDGRRLEVIHDSRLIDYGGERAILGTVIDVTERKRAESERENLIRELTDKNSELERFTYTVSHDLKSPLITIAGFLGYLEQDAVSGDMDRLRSDTLRIQNAVDKMERLLNELLELSRIGRLMNPPAEVPFEDIAREALDNVHGQMDSRGVAVELDPNLPAVYGDRQRLVEVLQNLIDNAVKFMGDQPNPCIEIGQQGEEAGKPIFFVRDNGIGISPEYHGRIFGLFDKLDTKTEGTGIGLALVKRIVEFHGGRIWVESEAGKGATFYFTLPVPPADRSI